MMTTANRDDKIKGGAYTRFFSLAMAIKVMAGSRIATVTKFP